MPDDSLIFPFVVSFSEELLKSIEDDKQKGNRIEAVPLVRANRAAVKGYIELGFSLARIYRSWMAALKVFDKPLFTYQAFRAACIKEKLYTPGNTDSSTINFTPSDISLKSESSFTPKEKADEPEAKEILVDTPAPVAAALDSEVEYKPPSSSRPRRIFKIERPPPNPLEVLPDNTLRPFSTTKPIS